MQFPLSFWDISLWLAITSMILLVASELTSPRYGSASLLINKKALKDVAILTAIIFLITVLMRIYEIIRTP
jgi:hypothetical protein